MNSFRIVHRSLTHHWRINAAVALGVAAATAVLTGALLVGDSVRGSLRGLTLDRLGGIDEVLVTDRFFRQQLIEDLRESAEFQQHFDRVAVAVLFPHATVERQGAGRSARAAGVLVVGCDESFWQLDRSGVRPQRLPGRGEIVVNQTIADEWGAVVGDEVVVRLPKPSQVPADSPLAKKSDRIRSVAQLEIVAIVPTEGLGRFSLRPSQRMPRNVFVSMETLQNALDQQGKVNAALVSLPAEVDPLSDAARTASHELASALRPSLEDYGLSIKRVRQVFRPDEDAEEDVVFEYFSLSTDRMILSPAVAEVAAEAFADYGSQPLLTYLANSVTREGAEGEVPYSLITAVDSSPAFDLRALDDTPIGPLGDHEIVLNQWAADDRQAQVGDKIRVSYFAPETTHGKAVERTAEFTLKAITPLTEPAQPFTPEEAAVYFSRPTLANDPDLTPEVKGVTDQESIDDWDPPFPFDLGRIQRRKPRDDDYWKNHRTTPKAFISLAAGRKLWGSRFGDTTSLRIAARDGLTVEQLERDFLDQLAERGETLGFDFIPVKRRQLEASKGTTPFDGLFLGLSFFIIAAALLLVALLFRLGIEQRADEVGILLAVGFRRRLAGRLLVTEGALVAAAGAALGIVVGVGYAWLMLAGLRTWWVDAITTPFLQFHVTGRSLLIGYVLGVVVSVGTIAWSIRQTRRVSVWRLLSGQASDAGSFVHRPQRLLTALAGGLVVLAVGLLVLATQLGGMPQAGAFVGGGAALLAGLLLLIWGRLKQGGRGARGALAGSFALSQLAMRNAARNPSRSATTIGLMATASFLIVAMSSFRLDPTVGGAGGFDLVAESSDAIFPDLNTPEGREQVLAGDAQLLTGGVVIALRLQPGDDASCNNLYQSTQPRVLGIPPSMIEHFDDPSVQSFSWAGSAAQEAADKANPWRLLANQSDDDAIPVVIDMNTAMYSLKPPLMVGSVYEAAYDGRPPMRFRVVGLLENSVLQGSLMIAEERFKDAFPEINGYRYFLIRSPAGKAEQVVATLEDQLGDQGFDAVSTASVLEQLLAVQNTYLSTFQSLGALGLLLGTFGLATVQLRNVVERRGELALLRASGFRRSMLARLVMLENVALLIGGLATGVVAALLAVLPHKLVGEAAVPSDLLVDLAIMLGAVLLVGIVSSLASVRAALATPVLTALRGD